MKTKRGYGLGSALVGSTTLPRNSLAFICEICSRCNGEGRKAPMLIAGKWVGGDNEYLCYRCRGTGALTFALFPDQQASLARKLVR